MSAILKKSELRNAAKTAIAAAEFISAKSIPVVIRNGKNDKTIEKHLNRGVGNCVVIEPIQEWSLRDQGGSETIVDVLFIVAVKQNPERNADDGGASVDILDVCDAATNALTRRNRHPGGEFFKVDTKMGGSFSQDDEGLWQYIMFFTKESVSA